MTVQEVSVEILHETISVMTPEACLQYLSTNYPGQVIFSSSMGMEDQVITHMVASGELPIRIFTLDTGRLFPETYSTWDAICRKYNIEIEAHYPASESLSKFVSENGPNCFYESVEHRKNCCRIRKVEPLKKALEGNSIWITGIRAEQSPNRETMKKVEWDETNQIIKCHPLLDLTAGEIRDFVQQNNIPYNPLHDKGFVSIGCAPCTRAIKEGEDFRAGRWWWEDQSKKECGLHSHPLHEK